MINNNKTLDEKVDFLTDQSYHMGLQINRIEDSLHLLIAKQDKEFEKITQAIGALATKINK